MPGTDHANRRTFLRASLGFVAAGLGAWYGWSRWNSKSRRLPAEYRAVLGDLFEAEIVGPEIQLIGKDYLSSNGTSPLRVDQLLADISGMDRYRLANAEAGLAASFREEVSRRIATELDSGEVVQLHGYFVAPTFGRLCAAIVLVLQA